MIDYVQAGQTLSEFSEDYNVPVEQAQGVLELPVKGLGALLAKAA